MAVSMFLEIPGVEGESQADGFKDKKAMDIFSFSFGASNPTSVATGSGSGAGKVDLSSFSVQKVLDNASPKLFNTCCAGKHFDKATLTCQEAGGDSKVKYLVVNFEEVFVNSISWGGAGSEKPSESVSFSFGKIDIQYNMQDEKGATKAGGKGLWDIRADKG